LGTRSHTEAVAGVTIGGSASGAGKSGLGAGGKRTSPFIGVVTTVFDTIALLGQNNALGRALIVASEVSGNIAGSTALDLGASKTTAVSGQTSGFQSGKRARADGGSAGRKRARPFIRTINAILNTIAWSAGHAKST
jgi:hypothetical protein